MSTAVPARAAVLASEKQAVSVADTHGYDDAMPTFSPNSKRDVTTLLVLLEPHERAAALGRTALQARTDRQRVRTRLPNWVAIFMSHAGGNDIPGPVDVPVWFDPASRAIEAIDVDALTEQAAPFRDLTERVWRDEDGWLRTPRFVLGAPKKAFKFMSDARKELGFVVGEIKNLGDTGAPPETPRPAEPAVEGIDYDRWIEIKAGLKLDDVHVSHVDMYASFRGAPVGRWPAIDAEWGRRAGADPWTSFELRRRGA